MEICKGQRGDMSVCLCINAMVFPLDESDSLCFSLSLSSFDGVRLHIYIHIFNFVGENENGQQTKLPLSLSLHMDRLYCNCSI